MKQDGNREGLRGSFLLIIGAYLDLRSQSDPGFPRTSDVINRAKEAEIYGDAEDR